MKLNCVKSILLSTILTISMISLSDMSLADDSIKSSEKTISDNVLAEREVDPNNISANESLNETELNSKKYELSKVSNIDSSEDLYSYEGLDSFVNYSFEIYSHSKSIMKDSLIEYQREDGSIVSFKATNEGAKDGEYYFLITPDTRGVWKLYSLNGNRVKNDKLNFIAYQDAKEFNEINNKNLRGSNRRVYSRSIRSVRNIYRYEGASRIETAINISKNNFSSSNSVIITNAWKQTDAIAASSLATNLNAPILYTGKDYLNSDTKNEISRLGAKSVYIVGGNASITDDVQSELYGIDRVNNVKRISGENRAGTALELAKEAAKYKKGASAIVVSGESESDCLAVSAVAAENGCLMFYSIRGSLDIESKNFIKRNFNSVFTMSGDYNISYSLQDELRSLGLTVRAKTGNDSYDLSLKLSNDPMFYNNINDVYLTSGKNSADGIPGSVLAAKKGVPLILVDEDINRNDIVNYVNNKNISNVYILGGVNSISSSFEDTLKSYSNNANTNIGLKRQKVVDLAKAQIGKPYVWGAMGPDKFDCSGLVFYVYKNALGINVPRQSSTQSSFGKYVSMNNLQPGDLVFWGYPKVTHVGIYIGDGNIIHAPNEKEKVKIQPLNTLNKYMRYNTSRSFI